LFGMNQGIVGCPPTMVKGSDGMPLTETSICQGCWDQMRMPIPIRGPLAFPLRLAGIRVSRMHPNLCTICETQFEKRMGAKQVLVPATILFADVRGYTDLSERVTASRMAGLLSAFYEHCAGAIWERDGIVNKLIGDAVFAIFNFPIRHDDHPRRAVEAGLELQRRCRAIQAASEQTEAEAVGVGVGVHTGEIAIGDVGELCRDFTAIGPAINLAARLQGAARPGEVLVSAGAYDRLGAGVDADGPRQFQLKGIEQPVSAYVVQALDR
jgi:adenylate cyclase